MHDDGTPVEPPTSNPDEYDPAYAVTTGDCSARDLGACDDLWVEYP